MDAQISLKDVHGLLRRRYKIAILVFSSVFMLSVVIALVLPSIYQSQTMILIDAQQIPQDFVKSTITTYAQQRLEMANRQIMKYSQLKEIVLQYGLYPDMVNSGDTSGAVEELRENIVLETISTKEGTKSSTVAFTLAFGHVDPETSRKVTAAIADLYLQEELKARGKLVSVTADFLTQELENMKTQVQSHEERISEFKTLHSGKLPENTAFNMQNMSRLEREMENIDARIRTLEDRRIYLKGQLASIEPLRPVQTEEGTFASNPQERLKGLRLQLIRQQSVLSEKHPDIRKLKAEIAKLEAQVGPGDEFTEKLKALEQKQTSLTALRSRLSPKHPDVIRLEKEVEILSSQVENSMKQNSINRAAQERPDNPAYINIMTQVVSAEAEIKSLQQLLLDKQKDYENYRNKIDTAPTIEKEYKDLTLDYANAKAQYNDILNKLMEAQVSQQMEQQQIGEKFSIIEPAYLPTKPSKPNRIAIMLLGFVMACGAGLGVAAVQESMDHSLKNEGQLARITGVPVFSTFPMVETAEERRSKYIRKTVFAVGAIGVVIVILICINQFAMPLDEFVIAIRTKMAL